MIKQLKVTNYLGDSIILDLARPEKSGFAVMSIDGIGPGKSTIGMSNYSTTDGSSYAYSRKDSRNITIQLAYMSYPSIETNRQKSYRYFPVKKPLTLEIVTENRDCQIIGYVESNEPDIFSENETTQISIICPYPWFTSVRDNTTFFYGVEPEFEFPFSSNYDEPPSLEFGSIHNNTHASIYYTGDSEVGIEMHMHALGPVENITIYDNATKGTIKILTDRIKSIVGEGVIKSDDIIISTVTGNKYAKLVRDGIEYNILNALDRNIEWFKLSKGDNIFAYSVEKGWENVQFKVINKVVYEGV